MLAKILSELLPFHTQLIAVSKTKSAEAILKLYEQGQRDFGENYVQEIVEKAATLPKDIRWHFIGHLQSNKVKAIAPFVHMIHTLDSLSLLETVEKQAIKNNRMIDCLLQFKINEEDTKFGLLESEIENFFENDIYKKAQHVRIVGVMGMSTFTTDKGKIRSEFKKLKSIYDSLKLKYFPHDPDFKEISMGMSDDYDVALEEGSTMVRIGSLLFGKR